MKEEVCLEGIFGVLYVYNKVTNIIHDQCSFSRPFDSSIGLANQPSPVSHLAHSN
jgi:hypothetical protein